MNIPSVCVIVGYYVAGFLVLPFFWSFLDGWPFAKARLGGDDALVAFLMCVLWPAILFAVLVCSWWCAMSSLGTWARSMCDKTWGVFTRRTSES